MAPYCLSTTLGRCCKKTPSKCGFLHVIGKIIFFIIWLFPHQPKYPELPVKPLLIISQLNFNDASYLLLWRVFWDLKIFFPKWPKNEEAITPFQNKL
jgi:hypothetical protein